MHYSVGRILLLVSGCLVLGAGVALLLTADLGSDGYSMLVHGVSLALDIEFLIANLGVGILFVSIAAARGLRPGLGTVVQVAVVGATVSLLLELMDTPGSVLGQGVVLALAFPVLAVGIALYLGSQTGAGPAEAPALAFDPPVPFKWSYSVVQGVGALVGWLLGATVGVGTIAVVLLLGPLVDLVSRLMGYEVRQRAAAEPVE